MAKSTFVYQGLANPGTHSVIVYVPETDTFMCKNISLDDHRRTMLGQEKFSRGMMQKAKPRNPKPSNSVLAYFEQPSFEVY
jgi:hypothetical protein